MTASLLLMLAALFPDILVGVICFQMARKALTSPQWLDFHAAAAKAPWQSLPGTVQAVVLFLLRLTGLGFAVSGAGLMLLPAAAIVLNLPAVLIIAQIPALLFAGGLALLNRRLADRAGTPTPWTESLTALAALGLALLLSVIAALF